MSKYITLLTLAAAVVSFGGIAQGELLDFSSSAPSTWDQSGAFFLQEFSSAGPFGLEMTAQASSVFIITSNTTNDSGFTWTAYLMELNPLEAATFVHGSAQSTDFQSAIYPDDWTIEFQEPIAVAHGEQVTFEFKVDIPTGPPYTFTLTQTPIPEPATVVLLGLGTLALLTRPKK